MWIKRCCLHTGLFRETFRYILAWCAVLKVIFPSYHFCYICTSKSTYCCWVIQYCLWGNVTWHPKKLYRRRLCIWSVFMKQDFFFLGKPVMIAKKMRPAQEWRLTTLRMTRHHCSSNLAKLVSTPPDKEKAQMKGLIVSGMLAGLVLGGYFIQVLLNDFTFNCFYIKEILHSEK